jgi:TetR/AcrR family transcriptional regulator, ethionamide resistance regulator
MTRSQPVDQLAARPAELVLGAAFERRPPSRGERRQAAILASLGELLAEKPLADIAIEEITTKAGVTRPAFYFYFATKAAAVAALMGEIFDTMVSATWAFFEREHGTPRERLRESLATGAAAWHEHGNLVCALYDASGIDPEIGRLLDQWVEQYIELTAQRIERERASGRAPLGTNARDLAAVLIGMNERAFLRDLRADSSPDRIERTIAALVDVWASTLYRDLG